MDSRLMRSVVYKGSRGLWRLTSFCWGCDLVSCIGRAAKAPSEARLKATEARHPRCSAHWDGRACGFALSYLWTFQPLSKVDPMYRWLKPGERP